MNTRQEWLDLFKTCPVCDARLYSTDGFFTHLTKEHSACWPREITAPCPICGGAIAERWRSFNDDLRHLERRHSIEEFLSYTALAALGSL